MITLFFRNPPAARTAVRSVALAVMTVLLADCAGYSCGNSTGSHCYGIATLPAALNGEPNFRGFVTAVDAVPLNSGNGEINNEIWVVQQGNPACGSIANSQCWIEVGLSAGADAGGCSLPSNETHIFWADNRPNQGFFCHDQGALQPQEFNQPVFLAIAIRPPEPNSYDVEALTCTSTSGSGSCPRRAIIGKSSNNAMAANLVEMGMELAGNSGASAPVTHFNGSIAPNPNVIFGWTYVNVDGSVITNTPVKGGWSLTPSTNPGGSFFTSCCQ
jgi:hypothetical protein